MKFLRDGLAWAKKQVAKVAEKLASATTPTPGTARLSPAHVFNQRRVLRSGAEIRWLKTQRHNGLTSRAGRSKYDPPELKEACERARLRAQGIEGGHAGTGTAFRSIKRSMRRVTAWMKKQGNPTPAPA